MSKRKICVALVDRANYGRMRPVMYAIRNHPDLTLQTVCAGTMVLERFGKAVDIVENDGFEVHGQVYVEVEGSVPVTMAKSLGFATIEFAGEFQRLQPDIVLLIGDRYECLAAAQAAAYQNICLAHIQGGEISGGIDECARHAISKFAHFHFPATARSAEFLVRMGENPATVFNVGCPVGDYIHALDTRLPRDIFARGVGASVDHDKPFFLAIFHPVTTEFGDEGNQVGQLLAALDEMAHPTVWLWPNIDAGSDHVSKRLRSYRERHPENGWLHLVKNLPPETFQKALKKTCCAIGNSSSFVRDSTFSGTPVVLVGDRQEGRELGENTVTVQCTAQAIRDAVVRQCAHGRYQPLTLYGDGHASCRIAQQLAGIVPYKQKRICFLPNAGMDYDARA
ncbi:MAG: UDP-N-acetylglucosamine 2-epimerase (hydrolyzing) [Lentisphaerae bacterium]|nr:UDP-N-acetylglucosamine 2-epimerase (hydrolyzing) [Lentisphaerota bacterium]